MRKNRANRTNGNEEHTNMDERDTHRFTDDRNIQMYCLFAPSVNLHVLDHRSLTKCPNTEKYKGWENLKKKKKTSQRHILGKCPWPFWDKASL